jgi:hypothetical protein
MSEFVFYQLKFLDLDDYEDGWDVNKFNSFDKLVNFVKVHYLNIPRFFLNIIKIIVCVDPYNLLNHQNYIIINNKCVHHKLNVVKEVCDWEYNKKGGLDVWMKWANLRLKLTTEI